MSWNYFGFRPYVSVAQRRRNAQREVAKLAKKGKVIRPVHIDGRTIARSFWGNAWCDNLESYSDFANRLPRGRTYVRNGSVVHLDVRAGEVEALVSGSELYQVKISLAPAAKAKWKALCRQCAGAIGSLVELLQGRLSDRVMDVITRRETGLFPSPTEIKMKCSCPDWATMCKHVAAVLYGVGARLDQSPELLFVLRSVDHEALISQAAAATDLVAKAGADGSELDEGQISAVFGIELEAPAAPEIPAVALSKPKSRARKKPVPIVPVVAKQAGRSRPQPAKTARRKPTPGAGD